MIFATSEETLDTSKETWMQKYSLPEEISVISKMIYFRPQNVRYFRGNVGYLGWHILLLQGIYTLHAWKYKLFEESFINLKIGFVTSKGIYFRELRGNIHYLRWNIFLTFMKRFFYFRGKWSSPQGKHYLLEEILFPKDKIRYIKKIT